MKALTLITVLISFTFFFSSCTENTIIPTTGPNQTDAMTFTITGSANGYTTFPAGENKPYRHFEGSGTGTPGGTFQVIMDYWAIPTGALTGIAKFGNATLITETGDKIYGINLTGSYTINLTDGKVYCNCAFDIAGGTGEYDNIIGEISNLTVTINISDRYTQAAWDGTYHRARPISGEFVMHNGTVTGSCAEGYLRRRAEGNAIILHLGNCTAWTEHCISFTSGAMVNGTGAIIANNGDEIQATYDGYAVPIPNSGGKYAFKMFITFDGGTGKYTNATGFGLLNGTTQEGSGDVPGTFDGALDW